MAALVGRIDVERGGLAIEEQRRLRIDGLCSDLQRGGREVDIDVVRVFARRVWYAVRA